jgi:predicted ABC-class ATPase
MIAFCNPVAGRKHRAALSGGKFTIMAEVERGLWAHVVDGGTPLLFTDKRLAVMKAKELSRAA